MKIHHATRAKAAKFQITLSVEDNEVVATKGGVRLAAGLQGNKVLEDAITKATGKPAKGNSTKTAKPVKAPAAPAVADKFETAAKEDGWKKTRWGFRKDGEEAPEATTWEELCEEAEIDPDFDIDGVADDEDDDEDDGEEGGKSVVKAKYKAKYKPTKNRCGDELSHRMNEHCSREDDAGDQRINLDALRKFAKANDCWVDSYASLKSRTGTFNGGMAMMNVNNRLRAMLRRIEKTEERKFDIDKDVSWK